MGVHRITVNMRLDAQLCQNAWHVTTPTDGLSEGQLQDFVDGVVMPQRNNTAAALTYESVEFRRVDISGTSGAIYVPTSWPVGGNAGGAYLPSYCAMLFSGRASGQPKPSKIRKFVPGLLESWTDGSFFGATGDTTRAAIADAWQAYIDGVHDAEIVAVSYKDFATGIVEDNVNGRWNLITTITSHDALAIMGSRRVGRGV
jgi:hypothetical protein